MINKTEQEALFRTTHVWKLDVVWHKHNNTINSSVIGFKQLVILFLKKYLLQKQYQLNLA